MNNFLFIIWLVLNSLLLVFVIHELYLLIAALTRKSRTKRILDPNQELPLITVQLPVYNEKYVIRRLLESAANLNYPSERLEIQVLDDSSDETTEIIANFIREKTNGHVFSHVRRADRHGFKAGALAYGLKQTKGEFIGIFDADFVISPDFLLQVVPYFKDESVGVVQTKWKHLNESYSLLTRAQAIMLNTHFSIEQLGRSSAHGFINFNGTAGVWRRACIDDAGGWQTDTLTEDLDLSYRAQVKNWRFEYLFDVGSPAELPVTFEAYRTQQHRWSKGAAECVRKNWSLLWKAKISMKAKVLGSFHLLNSSVYLLIIPLVLFSPIIYLMVQNKLITVPYNAALSSLGALTTSLLMFIFFVGNILGQTGKLKKIRWFIPSIFIFFAMTSGIALFMVIGVLEGYLKKQSDFVRTPKFGESEGLLSKVKTGYDFKKELSLKLFEGLFLGYGLFILFIGVRDLNGMMIIYASIITIGYSLALLFPKRTFHR